MDTFNDLDLLPAIQRALKAADYVTPTEIQAKAIPVGLDKRDILGCAQTGTGKTAAFVLPILHHLGSNRRRTIPNQPYALILSPTRELAIQIAENISKYGRFLKMHATLVYGGVSQINQVRSLRRGTPILVATPGRLLDLMEQGHLSLSKLEHFVLDEADRMLDMGFLPDLQKIIADLPEQRQSLFFSATLAPKITALAEGMLRDPVSIQITPEQRSIDKIEQILQLVKTSEKLTKLTDLLIQTNVRRAIVFIRTKRNTDKVEKKLIGAGLPVGAIHGGKSQNSRQRTLTAFRRGKINILVATDVAARGIDVDDVSHVINFDLPEDAETYVHRIGRTGRAGASGTAITFYTEAQSRDVREIERYLGGETDAPQQFARTRKGSEKQPGDARNQRSRRSGDNNRTEQRGNRARKEGGGQYRKDGSTGKKKSRSDTPETRSARSRTGQSRSTTKPIDGSSANYRGGRRNRAAGQPSDQPEKRANRSKGQANRSEEGGFRWDTNLEPQQVIRPKREHTESEERNKSDGPRGTGKRSFDGVRKTGKRGKKSSGFGNRITEDSRSENQRGFGKKRRFNDKKSRSPESAPTENGQGNRRRTKDGEALSAGKASQDGRTFSKKSGVKASKKPGKKRGKPKPDFNFTEEFFKQSKKKKPRGKTAKKPSKNKRK